MIIHAFNIILRCIDICERNAIPNSAVDYLMAGIVEMLIFDSIILAFIFG